MLVALQSISAKIGEIWDMYNCSLHLQMDRQPQGLKGFKMDRAPVNIAPVSFLSQFGEPCPDDDVAKLIRLKFHDEFTPAEMAEHHGNLARQCGVRRDAAVFGSLIHLVFMRRHGSHGADSRVG
jgi:hypothetical protein